MCNPDSHVYAHGFCFMCDTAAAAVGVAHLQPDGNEMWRHSSIEFREHWDQGCQIFWLL